MCIYTHVCSAPKVLTLVSLWRLSPQPLNTCNFRLTTHRALSPVSGQCGQTCPHRVIQLFLNQNPATPTHCDSKTSLLYPCHRAENYHIFNSLELSICRLLIIIWIAFKRTGKITHYPLKNILSNPISQEVTHHTPWEQNMNKVYWECEQHNPEPNTSEEVVLWGKLLAAGKQRRALEMEGGV